MKEIILWPAQRGGILISKDNAEDWEQINLNISDSISITSIAINHTSLIAATNGAGIFISNNEGKNWTGINLGIPIKLLTQL